MPQFKLSDWADLSEIAASIVVVLSLVYLAFEVNLNTKAMQHASYQTTIDQLSNADSLLAVNEDLHRIVTTANDAPSDVSSEEWSRYEYYQFPRFGIWEYMYLARQEDMLSDIQWLALDPYFRVMACTPGGVRFWKDNPAVWSDSFRGYVNSDVLPSCSEQSIGTQ